MAALTAVQQEATTGRLNCPDIEQIALDMGMPVEDVQQIYDHELQLLSSAARIQQFVGVIATRRVLLKLRGADSHEDADSREPGNRNS